MWCTAQWLSWWYYIVHSKVAKRVNLESSHHKKVFCNYVWWLDINYTYCADHFTIYTNIESSYCTYVTTLICQLNVNFFKKGAFLYVCLCVKYNQFMSWSAHVATLFTVEGGKPNGCRKMRQGSFLIVLVRNDCHWVTVHRSVIWGASPQTPL